MSSSPVVFFFGVPGPMPRTYNSRHPLLKDRLLSVLFVLIEHAPVLSEQSVPSFPFVYLFVWFTFQDVEARSTQPVQDSVGGYRQPEFEIDGLDEDSSSGLDEISSRLFAEARPVLGYGQSDVDDESQPGAPVFVAFQPILQLLFPKRCSDPTGSHGKFFWVLWGWQIHHGSRLEYSYRCRVRSIPP